MTCIVCSKKSSEFPLEYVDEFGSPKYYIQDEKSYIVLCSPMCSLAYMQNKKEDIKKCE